MVAQVVELKIYYQFRDNYSTSNQPTILCKYPNYKIQIQYNSVTGF